MTIQREDRHQRESRTTPSDRRGIEPINFQIHIRKSEYRHNEIEVAMNFTPNMLPITDLLQFCTPDHGRFESQNHSENEQTSLLVA